MLKDLGRFLSRPPVQTGITLAVSAAIRSYQPSLVDRSRNDQALIVAGSMASGYVAGNLGERAIEATCAATGIDRAIIAAAVAGTAAAAMTVADERAPVLNTLGRVASATAITSGALSLRRRRRGRGPLRAAVETAGIGAVVAICLRREVRAYSKNGRRPPPSLAIASSLAAGTGIAVAAGALVAVERASAAAAVDLLTSTGSSRRRAPTFFAHVAIACAFAAGAKLCARRVLRLLDAAGDHIEPGYASPPTSRLVSGGADSVVAFADLGVQGRRFVSEMPTPEAIDIVLGTADAIEPIRLYIGVDSAPGIDERVELAMMEIRRTHALDRSLVIIGSPAGTGYLNHIPIEAAEYFMRGDVASVTIQYGKRPSLLSVDRVGAAQQQHLALVEEISKELSRRPREGWPRVVLYGESLGAQTSQDAFPNPGYEALVERSIQNALWVGTPYPAKFRRAVLSANPDDSRFGRSATIDEHDAATQFTFLDHHDDPVTLFNLSIFHRRPPWLGPPSKRPPNISRTQRWVPAVTFWQTVFDTKNAARVVPGDFNAFGHDYRADLAEFVRAAYHIPDVTDEQMVSVERALRRSEIERAARIEPG
ncbi:MAG: alpha/beta-hydrolase family protein [Acidobacteria bacterium]|nr:alpha/beta-hydrolase family protein [Acidobacteriota bacterium]